MIYYNVHAPWGPIPGFCYFFPMLNISFVLEPPRDRLSIDPQNDLFPSKQVPSHGLGAAHPHGRGRRRRGAGTRGASDPLERGEEPRRQVLEASPGWKNQGESC